MHAVNTESEANHEKVDFIVEHEEEPNDGGVVATIRDYRSGDQPPTVRYRNPLKRRTKIEVVPGSSKGRTLEIVRDRQRPFPEFSNGIRKRGLKE
jgi:hypothetical protein